MKKEKPTVTYYDKSGKEITKKLNTINGRKLISNIKEIVYNSYNEQFFYFKNVDFTKYFASQIVFDQNNNTTLILENCIFNELEIINGQAQIINCISKNNKYLSIKTALMNDIDIIINKDQEDINYYLNINSQKIYIDGNNKAIKSLQIRSPEQITLQNIRNNNRRESKDIINIYPYTIRFVVNNSNINVGTIKAKSMVLNNSKIIPFGQIKIKELSGENYSLEANEEIIVGNTIYKRGSIVTDTYLKDERNKLTIRLISDLKGIKEHIEGCIKSEQVKKQENYQQKIKKLNQEIEQTKSRCNVKTKKLVRKLNSSPITQFMKKESK